MAEELRGGANMPLETSGADVRAKVKFRFVEFELEGGDDAVKSSIRDLAGVFRPASAAAALSEPEPPRSEIAPAPEAAMPALSAAPEPEPVMDLATAQSQAAPVKRG